MSQSRRSFLKGLSLGAGLPVLGPILSRFDIEAAAASGQAVAMPKRFVFISIDSGIMPGEIRPASLASRATDKFFDAPLAQCGLEPRMKPLEPLKNYVSIIQGLSAKMCNGGHSANHGFLGVFKASSEKGAPPPKRATVDFELATMFPGPMKVLASALSGGWGGTGYEGVVLPDMSASGPGKSTPHQASPELVFDQLFGTVAASNGNAVGKLKSKRRVLDFLTDDVKKVGKALPADERAKLAHYLDALENLKEQDVKIAALRQSLEKHVPKVTDKYTSLEPEARQEAHFDLIAAALISGITNVALMKFDVANTIYKGLGIDLGLHGIGHGKGSGDGKSSDECRVIIHTHHFNLIANLAKKLKAVPEGNGNMLDNTMIVYFSNSGDAHHGRLDSWPTVVIGGCGGRLKLPGRYLQFPTNYGGQGHKTIGNWWTSVLNAFGNPIKHFGDLDAKLMGGGFDQTGPIPEIMI